MSVPPPTEYLSPDFDSTSLKIPQLRNILLSHGIGYSNTAKKADLVQAFEEQVKPKAQTLLASSANVKPSKKGIKVITDSDSVTDSSPASTAGIKRGRGRSKKVDAEVKTEPVVELETIHPDHVTVEPAVEPPPKRSRTSTAPPSEKPTRRKRTLKKAEDEDADVEGAETATPPPPKTTRSRNIPTESPASLPSVPSSSRRRSALPSSSSDVQTQSANPGGIKAAAEGTVESVKGKGKAVIDRAHTVVKKASEGAIKFADDLAEESEEEDEPPSKKKDKLKTPRRSSGEESGFSDYNPFQSGGEEAAERERRRRKSSMGASKPTPKHSRLSMPAQSNTTPSSILRKVGPSRESLRTPPHEVKEALRAEKVDSAEEYNRAVTAKLNQISSKDVERSPEVSFERTSEPSQSLIKRVQAAVPAPGPSIPLSIFLLLLLPLLANFKSQSASIGYCDPASTTNDIVVSRQFAQDSATTCVAHRTDQRLDPSIPNSEITVCDTSALPLLPFIPQPRYCTPCPPHAFCSDGEVVGCEQEFLLSTNPFGFLAPVADGLPGVGPRAFPPSCRPDTHKKRMIGGLAKEMEKDLAIGRGAVMCAGIGKDDGRKGEGERFGIEESTLRERYAERRDPKFTLEQFNDIFEAALKDLVEHGDVVESIDVHGHSWYAAVRNEMPLTCRARLHLTDQVSRWRSELSSTMLVLATIAYVRSMLKGRREEKCKVEELVQVALRRLQDQERLHFVDPSTTPNLFISPDQLRDLVMPPSSATASRGKLWKKVAELVEANSNVSVREREVNGEIWKTWEWSGVGERRVTWE